MPSILVTGATGFIGAALVTELRHRGESVIGLGSRDGRIDEPDTLERAAPGVIRWIFHLAGRVFVPDSWENPLEFTRVNTLGAHNVLEFGRKRKVPVTHVSSYLYGRPDALPIPEHAPAKADNPYALSKLMAEQACECYGRTHGMPVTVIRPFNVYGPGQDDRFLIPSIVRQALHTDAIAVADLKPRRDYVYLDDLVEALILTMEHPEGYHIFNIGSGESFSVQQVIDIVQQAAGTRKKVHCDLQARPFEIDDVVADISRARQHLAWRPRHSFAEGIGKVVAAARGSTP